SAHRLHADPKTTVLKHFQPLPFSGTAVDLGAARIVPEAAESKDRGEKEPGLIVSHDTPPDVAMAIGLGSASAGAGRCHCGPPPSPIGRAGLWSCPGRGVADSFCMRAAL